MILDAYSASRMAAVNALVSALAFYDSYRSGVLPANLLQKQRDYFGGDRPLSGLTGRAANSITPTGPAEVGIPRAAVTTCSEFQALSEVLLDLCATRACRKRSRSA